MASTWKSWAIFHVMFFSTFVVTSLIVNACQFVLFLTLRPLNRHLFRTINGTLMWMSNSQFVSYAQWWGESQLRVRCDPELLPGLSHHNSLVVMNHHCETDWLFGWMFAEHLGVFAGCRVLAKKAIAYIPTIGWSWRFSDFPFLERNWEADRETISSTMSTLTDYRSKFFILLFPEGTRVNPEKLKSSQKYAKDNGLPVLKHHLTPRIKGLVHMLRTADRSKLTRFYDVVLGIHPTDGGPATIASLLNGSRVAGDFYVRVFDTENLPRDEEGLKKFVFDLFVERDRLLDNYLYSGGETFCSADDDLSDHRPFLVPKTLRTLVNIVVLNLLVNVPILYGVGLVLLNGTAFHVALVLLVYATLYLALKRFADFGKIVKASSYGLAKKSA